MIEDSVQDASRRGPKPEVRAPDRRPGVCGRRPALRTIGAPDGPEETTSLDLGAALEREAVVFTQYLVASRPPPELVERYREAHRVLLTAQHPRQDEAVLSFAVTHPWALPYLDAALGILHPHALLRSKLLVMLAVLEASPYYPDFFLSESRPRQFVMARLCGYGLLAAMKLVMGLLLYPVAARDR